MYNSNSVKIFPRNNPNFRAATNSNLNYQNVLSNISFFKRQSWTKVVVTVNPLPRFNVVISNFTRTLIWGQGRHNIALGGGGGGGVKNFLSKFFLGRYCPRLSLAAFSHSNSHSHSNRGHRFLAPGSSTIF